TIISRMRIRPLMRRANVSEASWRSMPATRSHQCHQWGGEKSDGAGLGHGEEGRTRRKRRALNADVEVDDAVVVDVDFSVVIEVAVEPAAGAEWHVEVDPTVVVDVDLPVEV